MQQVSVRDVAALAARCRDSGQPAVLLDVREPWEVALARIEPAGLPLLTIPMQQIPARLAELDPEQPILVLCHHGMRSQQVALFLERQGHAEVFNISGGIDAWSREVDPGVAQY